MTLRLYKGPAAEGTAIQELRTSLVSDGVWALGPAEFLEDGIYTAQAMQLNAMSETGTSSPVTFRVDTVPPSVTLTSPESPSSNTTPSFTGTASDTTPVAVQIHAGATAKGTVVSTTMAAGTGASWTSGAASLALSAGEYTAVSIQEHALGNPAGRSEPVTLTVTNPPVIAAATAAPHVSPVASFIWFPPVPATGEAVTLISTSTDSSVPITGFAWALTGTGPFQVAGNVLTTSFSTPGGHVVQLRVTNVSGLSSLASDTINVVTPRAFLMQPFPVVRIAGTETAFGIKLRLLKVQQLPAGAQITVRCKGRGCPIKSITRVAESNKQGVAPVEFRRFERALRSGVTLEILVSKPGEIGKYTRFVVRRGMMPERVDMCLDRAGITPLVCTFA